MRRVLPIGVREAGGAGVSGENVKEKRDFFFQ